MGAPVVLTVFVRTDQKAEQVRKEFEENVPNEVSVVFSLPRVSRSGALRARRRFFVGPPERWDLEDPDVQVQVWKNAE